MISVLIPNLDTGSTPVSSTSDRRHDREAEFTRDRGPKIFPFPNLPATPVTVIALGAK
jgi:hypothetical protein